MVDGAEHDLRAGMLAIIPRGATREHRRRARRAPSVSPCTAGAIGLGIAAARRRAAQPKPRDPRDHAPGSAGDGLQHGLGDVEVGVDVLDVVVVLEALDQADDLLRRRLVARSRPSSSASSRARPTRARTRLPRAPGGRPRARRARRDQERRAVELDVVRACLRGREHELVLVHAFGVRPAPRRAARTARRRRRSRRGSRRAS